VQRYAAIRPPCGRSFSAGCGSTTRCAAARSRSPGTWLQFVGWCGHSPDHKQCLRNAAYGSIQRPVPGRKRSRGRGLAVARTRVCATEPAVTGGRAGADCRSRRAGPLIWIGPVRERKQVNNRCTWTCTEPPSISWVRGARQAAAAAIRRWLPPEVAYWCAPNMKANTPTASDTLRMSLTRLLNMVSMSP
jgi:hypothetical protein